MKSCLVVLGLGLTLGWSSGCKLKTEDALVPMAPVDLPGFWSDQGEPARYWAFAGNRALVDSPFDPSTGAYVVRITKLEQNESKLRFEQIDGGPAQEMNIVQIVGDQLTLKKASGSVVLHKLSDREAKRIFGEKYGTQPELWIQDIQSGAFKPGP